MTDLTEFANLSLDELTAELERMLQTSHQAVEARAERRAQKSFVNPFTPAGANETGTMAGMAEVGTTLEAV